MSQPLKLLIVDDHPFFRQGVKFFLSGLNDFRLIGECSSGEEALEIISTIEEPDVMLMDLKMKGMGGVETTEQLLKLVPHLKILVLTSFNNGDQIRKVIGAGARGYCLKDAPPEELVGAIRAVAGGGTYLGQGIPFTALSSQTSTETNRIFRELTHREMEVLELLAAGFGNKDIGEKLVVSEKTVKTHVANVLHKLEVKTRTQAALLANKHGLFGE